MKRIFTLLGIGLMSFYGQSQTALDFEETSNQYIWIGSSMNTVFTGTNSITIESWVKLESSGSFRTITGNYSSGMQFLLRVDAGKAAFWVENGSGYQNITGTSTIPTGTWTHIAGTWDGITQKVFVNGVLEASMATSGTFQSNISPLTISSSITSEDMDGLIDDVRIWNIARTDAEILANMNSCLMGTETGLLALYDFETGSGTTLVDMTGNGFNGILVNSPLWGVGKSCSFCNTISNQTINTASFSAICSADTTIEIASSELGVSYFLRDNANDSIIAGPIAGTGSAIQFNTGNISSTTTYNVNATGTSAAINFDGVDDYIDLGTSPIFDIQGDITLETWVKMDAYPPAASWYRLIGKGEFVSNRTYGLWVNENGVLLWQMWGSSNLELVGSTLALNTWYHVAATRSGNTCEIFVNGVSVASTTYTGTPNLTTQPATIGAAVVMHDWIDGQMDEVRIWNVARTATEIQENMGICLTGNETGLVANYDLNDGTGIIADDKSINGNDGIIINGPTWAVGSPNVYCSSCDLQLTTTPTITINPIANQTVVITDTELCPTNTGTTVTTASSEVGVNYFLRDNSNDSIIAGPITGTGSGLTFNTGNLNNSMTYNVYSAKPSGGLDFDGVDDYVDLGNASIFDIQGDITLETWVKIDAYQSDWVRLIGKGGAWTDRTYGLWLTSAGELSWQMNGTYDMYLTGPTLALNTWYHVAVTRSGNICEIFVNGIQAASTNYTGIANLTTAPATIGAALFYDWFDGQMGEVRIWNVGRTITEINANMNTCLTGTETGLVAYYQFEDGTGSSTLSDLTINGNNGTLTNMVPSTDWVEGATVCSSCDLEMTPTVTVTVQDVLAPVADATTLADATGECSVAMPTAPTATDNCSGSITGTTTTIFPITTQGTTVITWTFDDGNGNISTQMQNVVLADVTPPVADATTLADVSATCEVTTLTAPTATDACSATVTVTNNATLPITMVGTTVVTWMYDDGNGNTSTQTQNVIISSVDVTTTTTNFVITANNTTASSYQWIDCDNNNTVISGETNASYTATANGNYAVVIAEGNCSDTSMCVQIAGVGIDELSNLGVEIYPNPNNGEFTISTTQNNVTITVYAIDGKIILNQLQITEANQLINLGDIESGIYFVKVINQTNQKTIRLVVE